MTIPNDPDNARIELEVELGANPIRGKIRAPGGSQSIFFGWLELIGALERIRGPEAEAWGHERPEETDGGETEGRERRDFGAVNDAKRER